MVEFLPLRAHNAACSTLLNRVIGRFAIFLALLATVGVLTASADNARFDLTGPKVEVRVTRAGVTLPIASVPNLQPGDRLWLHPDLPATQSVRYLMVLAFLRGTTNPPPDKWFIRIETWDKKVQEEGIEIPVPDEAQQAVLFLAPVTGGDFTTLRSAVQGRPGIFVRASQDLAAAGFEQARIEKYIASMRQLTPAEASDPKQLQNHSNLIATTLALKPNGDCVKLPPEQQYTCLTQSGNQDLLDDGHGQSIIDALTGNTSQGLIGTVSTTQLAGGGLYSAYVGSIVDLVHIMGSLHTAQYQYIPAIAFPDQQSLNLRLNTPPSFHNPKSVIVIGLPSVQQTVPPPLRASDPKDVSCLQKPSVVLPVEGAPLVFSTGFAHDLVLHLNYPASAKSDQPQDIPLTADAFRGGLVLAPPAKRHALPTERVSSSNAPPALAKKELVADPATALEASASNGLTGTIRGFWGFDTFTGPTMPLQNVPGTGWKLADDGPADSWLIAGKDRHILLTASGTACVQSIEFEAGKGKGDQESFKPGDKPNTVDVTLNVPAHESGAVHLVVRQFNDQKPATVNLVSYNEPAQLDAIYFHAGDTTADLTGTSVSQVRQVEFGGVTFKPAGEGSSAAPQPGGKSQLHLALDGNAKSPDLAAGKTLTARATLQDGRTLSLPLTVEPQRPSVMLIGRADVPPDNDPPSQFKIKLGSESDLPVGHALMFSLKSGQPFPRDGWIEVASPDGSLHTKLSVAAESLVLEDPHTLLGTLQPRKAFGPSAFGPIRLRVVAPDGSVGDWLSLVTLVRLPEITGISCPVETPPAKPAPAPAAKDSTPPASSPDATGAIPQDSAGASSEPEVDVKPPALPTPVPPAAGSTTPATAAQPAPCTLTGSRLYFVDSVANDAAFTNPIRVPDGFVGNSIAVPAPSGAVYYLRLRDDPANTDTVTLPAGPL